MSAPTRRPTEPLENRLLLSTAAPHPVPVSDTAAAVHASPAPAVAPAASSANSNGGPNGENVTGGPSDSGQTSQEQSGNNADPASGAADPAETAPPAIETTGDGGDQSDASSAGDLVSSGGQENLGEATTQTNDGFESPSTAKAVPDTVNGSSVGTVEVVRPPVRVVAFGASGGTAAPVEAVRAVFNSLHLIEASGAESGAATDVIAKIPQAPVTVIAHAVTAVAAVAKPLFDAPPVAEATARALLNLLGQSDALATFADAVAGFAHESAAVGPVLAVTESRHFPWVVTAAVLGVDAVLIGHWYAARREQQRRIATDRDRLPFSVRCI